jgi:[ribosomal protein S5]-alanine N-acetyltransferase
MSPVIRAKSAVGEITLRPLRYRDRKAWEEVRRFNREWLTPWEATRPTVDDQNPLPTFWAMVRQGRREARTLRTLSLGIWINDGGRARFVGQITLGGIVFGAQRGGYIGYWIDSRVANKGFTTAAVVALTEYGFQELLLHRIEITMRPENSASKRVAEKAGYTFEGIRKRYLHIDGDWRDHLIFVKENPEIR